MVAEHGKTRYVGVNDLQAGMIVKKDVLGRKNKVLVNAGEVLSQLHVEKLKKWDKTEKPQGPALPRVNPKNVREPVRHAEYEGGYRVSHFNPRGIMVATSTASGEELPDIEQHPEKSTAFDKIAKPSVTFGGDSIPESTLVKRRNLRAEISELIEENRKLGGIMENKSEDMIKVDDLIDHRDAILKNNKKLAENN